MSLLLAWALLIGGVALIGYVLWPFLIAKYTSLQTGQWGRETPIDRLQNMLDDNISHTTQVGAGAARDALIDPTRKQAVTYVYDSLTDLYRPRPE